MAIDWGKLVEQGRAKAIGVSWNDEEMKARYELGISAELVRKGVLTLEEATVEENQIPDNKLLSKMSKEELKTLADELGIETPVDAKRLEIKSLITKSKLPTSETSEASESLE